jgi:hypothetical protein
MMKLETYEQGEEIESGHGGAHCEGKRECVSLADSVWQNMTLRLHNSSSNNNNNNNNNNNSSQAGSIHSDSDLYSAETCLQFIPQNRTAPLSIV